MSGLTYATAAHVVHFDFDRNWSQTVTSVDRAGRRTVAGTNLRGSNQILRTVTRNDQVVETTNAQGHTFLTTYDGLGRLEGSSDPRLPNPTTIAYKPGTTLVEAATADDGRTSSTYYDPAGRVNRTVDSGGMNTYYAYTQSADDTGRSVYTWGEAPNPTWAEYDELGRQVRLHTYRSGTWSAAGFPASAFNGLRDTTTWTYDATTGLLKQKTAAREGTPGTTSYLYDTLGRQTRRTDPRGWVTHYEYYGPTGFNVGSGHIPGLLKKIDYTDAVTTDVIFTYHRTGRLRTVTDAAGTRSFNYYE